MSSMFAGAAPTLVCAALVCAAACTPELSATPPDPEPPGRMIMATQYEEAGMPSNLTVGVESDPEYVLGFPMLMALTLTARPDGAEVEFMEFPTPFSLAGRVGVLIRNAKGEPVHELMPRVNVDMDHSPSDLTLEPGDIRRLLIDLSPIVPATLDPGVYSIEVFYASVLEAASATIANVRLREPTDSESLWRVSNATEFDRAGSWGAWVTSDPGDAPVAQQVQPPAAAAFHAAVRELAWSREPVDQRNTALLQSVVGVPRAEAMLIGAELLAASGASQEAERAIAAIDAQIPALAWLADATRRGFGLLKQVRPFD